MTSPGHSSCKLLWKYQEGEAIQSMKKNIHKPPVGLGGTEHGPLGPEGTAPALGQVLGAPLCPVFPHPPLPQTPLCLLQTLGPAEELQPSTKHQLPHSVLTDEDTEGLRGYVVNKPQSTSGGGAQNHIRSHMPCPQASPYLVGMVALTRLVQEELPCGHGSPSPPSGCLLAPLTCTVAELSKGEQPVCAWPTAAPQV